MGDRKIIVDIVCDGGLTWIKAIARNPKSINQICMGNSNYGVRSILDQADDFLECAKLYPCLFQTPTVNRSFNVYYLDKMCVLSGKIYIFFRYRKKISM